MTIEQATFEWKGRLGPFELVLSENTFPPSSISVLLSEALEVEPGATVFDVGCGCGVLGILAARLGADAVVGVDAAPDTAEVAQLNAERLGVADRVTFYQGSLFDPLPDDATADLIIGDVSGIPDTLARVSGWFPTGEGGGPSGTELPIRMIKEAPSRLRPGGRLLLPTGSLQDEERLLEVAREHFEHVENRGEKRLPLPQKLSDTPEVEQLQEEGVIDLTERGSRKIWVARAWECHTG